MPVTDDPLVNWVADRPGARVHTRPGAIAVTCADLCRWDRIAVHGDPAAIVRLLDEVLPEVGPSYRPIAGEDLMAEVAARHPRLSSGHRFGWMDTTEPTGRTGGGWITADGVDALLDEHHPHSYARPGGSGVERWAGIRRDGRLLAVAAEAWSSRRIGFVAGVATRTEARGQGLASALCGFVTDELLRSHDRVALVVERDNTAAIATYRRLGFAYRPVAAARWLEAGSPEAGSSSARRSASGVPGSAV